ncbi:MAG: response regulator transcription factor [Acidobacteria bacterium]|nr:response regulator transcription factor [Acidobacteriota bacterium]
MLTAATPVEAISIMAQHAGNVDLPLLDYEMPIMNGCVLADYLRDRYPEMKIILHSGADDIPASEMNSVDGFVPKGDGVERLLEEISVVAQLSDAASASINATELLPASYA